jgi:hypothetical protein
LSICDYCITTLSGIGFGCLRLGELNGTNCRDFGPLTNLTKQFDKTRTNKSQNVELFSGEKKIKKLRTVTDLAPHKTKPHAPSPPPPAAPGQNTLENVEAAP